MRRALAALALAAAALLRPNEAAEVSMESMMRARLRSEEEILADMTLDRALELVLGARSAGRSLETDSLLHGRLARITSGRRAAQVPRGLRGRRGPLRARRADFPSLDPAVDALNQMIATTRMKGDLSQIECRRFERSQVVLMQEAAADAAAYSGMAAEARARILESQAKIGLLTTKIPEAQGELAKHREDCRNEAFMMQRELELVTRDLGVVRKLLGLTRCEKGARSSDVPSLLQTGDSPGPGSILAEFGLVECEHCAGGRGLVMLQSSRLQRLLNSLQSEVVRGYVQRNLQATLRESLGADGPADGQGGSDGEDGADGPAVALTQEQVGRMSALLGAADDTTDDATADVEAEPIPRRPRKVMVCTPTTACKLTRGSCDRLQDKFILVEGEAEDRRQEIVARLGRMDDLCKATEASLVGQLISMGDKLRDAQAALAMETKSQIDAETSAKQKSSQHADMKQEYRSTLVKCCEEQNTQREEACALTKIRGELYRMEGAKVVIRDCIVSSWSAGRCSATCGGGVRELWRDVSVKPEGGAECPPLTAKEECNTQPCPVDCRLTTWSGWSSCTASCGGGVKERTRHIRRPARSGGSPCGDTEETESCNMQSCNRDCELSDWSDWGECSKACGAGRQRRFRGIRRPAIGTGRCWRASSAARRHWRRCNARNCYQILPAGRNYLQCTSKTDVILVVDSSGSLGFFGWVQSRKLAEMLVESFTKSAAAGNRVGLLEFSAYGRTKWIKHLAQGATVQDVRSMPWTRSGTWTHEALGMAESELIQVREGATPVVIVITDGRPSSAVNTLHAARRLSKQAKTLWLPVGHSAPIRLVKRMASWPWQDHIVPFPNITYLTNKYLINDVVARTCSSVE